MGQGSSVIKTPGEPVVRAVWRRPASKEDTGRPASPSKAAGREEGQGVKEALPQPRC